MSSGRVLKAGSLLVQFEATQQCGGKPDGRVRKLWVNRNPIKGRFVE